jgi:hypothetical protein
MAMESLSSLLIAPVVPDGQRRARRGQQRWQILVANEKAAVLPEHAIPHTGKLPDTRITCAGGGRGCPQKAEGCCSTTRIAGTGSANEGHPERINNYPSSANHLADKGQAGATPEIPKSQNVNKQNKQTTPPSSFVAPRSYGPRNLSAHAKLLYPPICLIHLSHIRRSNPRRLLFPINSRLATCPAPSGPRQTL